MDDPRALVNGSRLAMLLRTVDRRILAAVRIYKLLAWLSCSSFVSRFLRVLWQRGCTSFGFNTKASLTVS